MLFGIYQYGMEELKVRYINVLTDVVEYESKDVHEILKELESLSCPCDALKMICNEYWDLHGEANTVDRKRRFSETSFKSEQDFRLLSSFLYY